MDNTTQSQYAMFKGVRPNARNFKPYNPTSGQSFEAWAALNDVNILSLTDKSVVIEYAFIADGKKKWAKISGFLNIRDLEEAKRGIAKAVEEVRNEIDEAGR